MFLKTLKGWMNYQGFIFIANFTYSAPNKYYSNKNWADFCSNLTVNLNADITTFFIPSNQQGMGHLETIESYTDFNGE